MTELGLNVSLDLPISNFNFSAMGDRMAAFAEFTKALLHDSSLDKAPLITSLGHQFPWWKPEKARYALWAPSLNGETGLVMCVGSSNPLFTTRSKSAMS